MGHILMKVVLFCERQDDDENVMNQRLRYTNREGFSICFVNRLK